MTIKNYQVGGALAVIMVLLIAIVWDLHPAVFPDEYIHSRAAIWLPFSEAKISGYLYYLVYWSTGLFGDYYLQAARVLNAFFHVAGCFIIYLTASRLIEKKFAAIISLSVAIGPLATYVAFFMPDSMYFFFFWVFMLLMVGIDQRDRYSLPEMVVAGVAFGLLWLVKPHALFILPVYPIYLLIRNGSNSLIPSITFLAVSIIVKFTISIFLAGTDGLSWFGAGYSEHGVTTTTNFGLFIAEVGTIGVNILSHIVFLSFVIGLALVVVLSRMACKKKHSDYDISLYGLLLLIVMIGVVSAFAVSTYLFTSNIPHRLYVRYYGYALPIIIISMFVNNSESRNDYPSMIKVLIGATISILCLVPAYYLLSRGTFYPFSINITDIPEIALNISKNWMLFTTSVLTSITIFTWLYNPRIGINFYAYVSIPIVSVVSFIGLYLALMPLRSEHFPTRAGYILRNHIEHNQYDQVLVVGANRLQLDMVRMYARSGIVRSFELHNSRIIPDSVVNSETLWILTTDSITAPSGFNRFHAEGRVVLYKKLINLSN